MVLKSKLQTNTLNEILMLQKWNIRGRILLKQQSE